MELAKVSARWLLPRSTSLRGVRLLLIQPMTTMDSQQGLRLWRRMRRPVWGHSEVDHRPRGRSLTSGHLCPRRLCNGRDCGRVLGG